MIYTVTYTPPNSTPRFLAKKGGGFRHTTKYEAERTRAERAGEKPDVQIRPFKTMALADAWWAAAQRAKWGDL